LRHNSYDKLPINTNIVLDLPHFEGSGAVLHDVSRSHHGISLVHAPVWTALGSGYQVLDYDGANDYGDCPAADTVNLNFTNGDYSIGAWVKFLDNGSDMIIDREGVGIDGWGVYLFDNILGGHGYLNLRHNHSSLGADVSDNCYSEGWFENNWYFMGISRSGLYPVMYRNGVALTMSYEVSGMQDPDSAVRDLCLGVRYTKNANFYRGQMWRPRIWSRSLPEGEWNAIFESERAIFGV